MTRSSPRSKKVLIIHTGGTIGMGVLAERGAAGERPPAPSNARPLSPDHSFVKTLRKTVPELWRLAEIDVLAYSYKDSSEMTPRDWVALHGLLTAHSASGAYDAFVITHGTDTMVYTGTALSYLLPLPGKPVILTGSQRPLREIRTDARRNLINSVAIAAGGRVPEVSIFFDTLLLRANRAKKVHIEEYQAFDSPNYPRLAQERLKTLFNPGVQQDLTRRPSLKPRFEPRIQVSKVLPGATIELASGAQALLIEAFGCGNLPVSALSALLKSCRRKRVPVLLASQVQAGRLAPEIYEMGRRAIDLGAISTLDLTLEAALVKCMLLAGNRLPYDQWPDAIQSNWAGELSPTG